MTGSLVRRAGSHNNHVSRHGVVRLAVGNDYDISNELQRIPLIRNDPSFDRARLEPAALKDLYLSLLKEEARQDVEQADDTAQDAHDGSVSIISRKRRAPSPSLPTVDEAAKHAHLIPKLILRLYARYRAKVTEAIKSEERRYDALSQEIRAIEDEKRDEQLRAEQAKNAPRVEEAQPQAPESTSASASAPVQPQAPMQGQAPAQAQAQLPALTQAQAQSQPQAHLPAQPVVPRNALPAPSPAASPAPRPILPLPTQEQARSSPVGTPRAQSVEVAPNRDGLPERINHAQIDAVINHGTDSVRASASPRPSPRPSPHISRPSSAAATVLPPLSEMAPEPTGPFEAPPQAPHTPQLGSQIQAASGYRASPPAGHPSAFPPPYPRPSAQGPSPSPKLPSTIAQPSPSSSPRPFLPLPPGMKAPPQSPNIQNGAHTHRPPPPIQPHPSHAYASPTQRIPPVPLQPADRNVTRNAPAHVQASSGFPQPYPQYQGGPQPYPASQPLQPHPPYSARNSNQSHPPHQGGVQLPPFQVGPQEPNRPPPQNPPQHASIQQLRPAPTPPAHHGFPPFSPYSPTGSQAIPQQDQARMVSAIIDALGKSPWATWKAARPAHLPHPDSDLKESPASEPLSPVASRNTVPQPQKQTQPPAQDSGVPQDAMLAPSDAKSAPGSLKPTKASRKSTRQSRAGSAASSIVASSVRDRTRSSSVVSHTDSQPAPPSEASASARHVKDEPTTPAESLHQEILSAPAETPTASRPSRPRRSTMHLQQPQSQPTSKRKRQRSPSPPVEESEAVATYVAPRNDMVAASRNFQRLSAVIMNDISTHRHAGPFQKPVREKDAEGYGDIIRRPQDLKSIKAAITSGNRTIAAAAAKDASTDSPSATPSGNASKEGGLIMLEKTADLVPPRAIVNSSQLEKEVMRMFANAVMFNPGEGGMVQDAREMADDIEAKVRDWRSAERQVDGRDEDEDSAATGPGPGKRRKL